MTITPAIHISFDQCGTQYAQPPGRKNALNDGMSFIGDSDLTVLTIHVFHWKNTSHAHASKDSPCRLDVHGSGPKLDLPQISGKPN